MRLMPKVPLVALVSLVSPFPMLSLHTPVSSNIRRTPDRPDHDGYFYLRFDVES